MVSVPAMAMAATAMSRVERPTMRTVKRTSVE